MRMIMKTMKMICIISICSISVKWRGSVKIKAIWLVAVSYYIFGNENIIQILFLPLRMYMSLIIRFLSQTWSISCPGSQVSGNSLAKHNYCQISNISHTSIGNEFIDHSDVVGASPVGAAPTTSSFWTQHLASMDWSKTTARRDQKHLSFGIWCALYYRVDGTVCWALSGQKLAGIHFCLWVGHEQLFSDPWKYWNYSTE